ncbi:hypothetical protein E8D37_19555 [Nocardioides sp. GY 10127]|nr:hypothetical protein E8D37_19555 [Nocardioides sp. GY 10127]
MPTAIAWSSSGTSSTHRACTTPPCAPTTASRTPSAARPPRRPCPPPTPARCGWGGTPPPSRGCR